MHISTNLHATPVIVQISVRWNEILLLGGPKPHIVSLSALQEHDFDFINI